LVRVWDSEKGLFFVLVLLCLSLFIGVPLSATWKGGRIVFDILFSLLLVSGIVTVAHRPTLTIAISAATVATLAVRWAAFTPPFSFLRPWGQVLAILLLGVFTILVLLQVFREGPITGYRIQGAIVVYLLMGLIWAAGYDLIYLLLPGAFNFAQGPPPDRVATHGLVYYSFITLTTVGYGDISPVHPVARSLAMAEGLVGQLYPAILIARLVSMELETRRRR
jgi:hypothetical protein